jgi:hypothetical protein
MAETHSNPTLLDFNGARARGLDQLPAILDRQRAHRFDSRSFQRDRSFEIRRHGNTPRGSAE